MDEFVVGFGDSTEELTPIDIVMDICGLTYEEVLSCCEVISITESEIPDFDF